MTYRELQAEMANWTDEQLDSDVTIEMLCDHGDNECFAAELRIAGEDHPSLDEDHPVLLESSFDDTQS